jgi:alpha-galactosidase
VRVEGLAEFERHYDTYDLDAGLKSPLDFEPDIVVVAIGENVPALASEDAKTKFKDRFTKLLTTLKNSGNPAIFVRGSFWANKTKDEIMQKSCMAVGGIFVDISGLCKDESNYARSERSFAHAGVANHPGDKGMKGISDALLKAIASAEIDRQERKGTKPSDHALVIAVFDDELTAAHNARQ